MTLKNATSTSTQTFDVIQKTLATHKARRITFDYDEKGKVTAVEFFLEIKGEMFPFRLPARIKNVEKIMYGSVSLSESQKAQAYRTAWANVRDWISAQCAMIDTGMVEAQEVFLPYLIGNQGHTFYEEMVSHQFLLPSGEGHV